MSVEIDQPQIEALIQQHMATGAFRDVDELLVKALGSLHERAVPPADLQARSLVELCAPVRGLLTDEEVDTLFRRNPSVSRPIDLS